MAVPQENQFPDGSKDRAQFLDRYQKAQQIVAAEIVVIGKALRGETHTDAKYNTEDGGSTGYANSNNSADFSTVLKSAEKIVQLLGPYKFHSPADVNLFCDALIKLAVSASALGEGAKMQAAVLDLARLGPKGYRGEELPDTSVSSWSKHLRDILREVTASNSHLGFNNQAPLFDSIEGRAARLYEDRNLAGVFDADAAPSLDLKSLVCIFQLYFSNRNLPGHKSLSRAEIKDLCTNCLEMLEPHRTEAAACPAAAVGVAFKSILARCLFRESQAANPLDQADLKADALKLADEAYEEFKKAFDGAILPYNQICLQSFAAVFGNSSDAADLLKAEKCLAELYQYDCGTASKEADPDVCYLERVSQRFKKVHQIRTLYHRGIVGLRLEKAEEVRKNCLEPIVTRIEELEKPKKGVDNFSQDLLQELNFRRTELEYLLCRQEKDWPGVCRTGKELLEIYLFDHENRLKFTPQKVEGMILNVSQSVSELTQARKSRKDTPTPVRMQLRRADYLRRQEVAELAIRAAERALSKDPYLPNVDLPKAWSEIAQIAISVDQEDRAYACQQHLEGLLGGLFGADSELVARYNISIAGIIRARKDKVQSIEVLGAFKQGPFFRELSAETQFTIINFLAETSEDEGEIDKAFEYYEEALGKYLETGLSDQKPLEKLYGSLIDLSKILADVVERQLAELEVKGDAAADPQELILKLEQLREKQRDYLVKLAAPGSAV